MTTIAKRIIIALLSAFCVFALVGAIAINVLVSAVTGDDSETAGSTPSAAETTSTPAPTKQSPTTATTQPNATPLPDSARREEGLALLGELDVKGRAPKTGYDRECGEGEGCVFGPAWTDDVNVDLGRNGCGTRDDILARDLDSVEYEDGTKECVVTSGTLLDDPYTGRDIEFVRGVGTSNDVQIDHIVALSDAWQKGAAQWADAKRQEFANDPLNLIASDGPANGAKSDSDAATWQPENKAFRCDLAVAQVDVKEHYGLWVTQAEHDALARWIETC